MDISATSLSLTVEEFFVDHAAHPDAVGRIRVDGHLHLGGRYVLYLAVQGEVHLLATAKVIRAGMTREFQAATHHPLVEPFQPTKTAAASEVDVFGMHHALDR